MMETKTTSQPLDLDPDVAKRLFLEGGNLILLNVPEGTEIGIDMKSWNTGENFKGIKMIPPGIHMIHYSAVGKYGDVAPKVSFVHYFKQKEIVVKKWDHALEDFSTEPVSDEDILRIRANLLNLDKSLGAYPFETYELWTKLTNYISEPLCKRLIPECGVIRSALEFVSTGEKIEKRKSNERIRTVEEKEEELLPQLKPAPGTGCRFTSIPNKAFPDGSTPQDITKHYLDQSFTLDSMIGLMKDAKEIVGELQFSFICFLLGQSLEALDTWKKLVKLICNCKDAIVKRRQLYFLFLQALEPQLGQIPEDFLVDIVASNNVIYTSLRELFRTMEETNNIEGRLRCEAQRLQERLTEKFSWDFQDLELETGEDAPIIVELESGEDAPVVVELEA